MVQADEVFPIQREHRSRVVGRQLEHSRIRSAIVLQRPGQDSAQCSQPHDHAEYHRAQHHSALTIEGLTRTTHARKLFGRACHVEGRLLGITRKRERPAQDSVPDSRRR